MRPDNVTIGIYQYNIAWEDIEANRRKFEDVLESLVVIPDIVLLPEMYTTGFSMNPGSLDVDNLKKQYSWQQAISDSFNTCVLGSIISPLANGHFANELLATCPKMEQQSYFKRHLFFNEAQNSNYQQGVDRVCFDIKGLKVFPQICYDLRFPVWSRNNIGYDLLIYVANWPANRQQVWNTLLPARAIENQCYVIGVNRLGVDGNGVNHIGGSAVYSAKGDCLLNIAENEELSAVNLSIAELDKFRKKFPVLEDGDEFNIQIKKG